MEIPHDWMEITLRLFLAVILTAVIGFEREVRDKPAGLRTHMLVGLGSAAFAVFTLGLAENVDQLGKTYNVDPIRAIEGVMEGLGFLGAGAIIQSRVNVYGMTTAVGIWIAGAIGVGCGTGNYFAVLLTTFIALICLIPLRFLEKQLALRNPPPKEIPATDD